MSVQSAGSVPMTDEELRIESLRQSLEDTRLDRDMYRKKWLEQRELNEAQFKLIENLQQELIARRRAA